MNTNFSYLAFRKKNLKIEELLSKKSKIILKETTVLEEVLIISTRATGNKKIGTKSYSSIVAGYVEKIIKKIMTFESLQKNNKT
jgi:hypothetical protein